MGWRWERQISLEISWENVAWNSKLIVREDQAAALLIGRELFSKSLKMLDLFAQAGEYVISPKVIPLLTTESPEVISREYISCIVVYCSTKEHTYSCKIHTGDSLGQAYVHAEAEISASLK